MRRLLIIACGATKRHDAGLLPAIERYNGPPYRSLRASLRELAEARRPTIRILSAEFGLIPAKTPIPHYDRRMSLARAYELREPVRVALAEALADGDYAASFIGLGADYWPALLLDPVIYAHLGELTIATGGIGQRMAQLKAWLRAA
jgi:hypothetical protein